MAHYPAGAPKPPLKGRGSAENPTSRFERLHYAADGEEPPLPKTELLRDPSRGILSFNQSPDIAFDVSLNPYRGCEHGCIYCYARPTHEYLGFSAGLDFETKILVKERAPELLRRALSAPGWKPQTVALGAATDPYQPAERALKITRGCLAVFAEFRNPVALVTKSALVRRDVDLLADLAADRAAAVRVSITTLDAGLHRMLEPRASAPRRRLAAVEALAKAGVPVGVMVAPVIPAINDHEIPAIIESAKSAGASSASHIMLRLPHGVKELFEAWLARHFPDRRRKVLSRLRSVRGGKLYDSTYGSRMRGSGPFAEQVQALFDLACRRAGIDGPEAELSTSAFRNAACRQISLFP